jgi:nucleoside-diphosphate-sugar epimerase
LVEESNSLLKNLLIVGGSGFIGKWVVLEGIKRGYDVTVISSKLVNKDHRVKNVEYLTADINCKSELKKNISYKKFTHVVNLGGYINHSQYLTGGRNTLDVHFNGLLNLTELLDWSLLKSFVQIGSSDEYGDSPAPQKENYCPKPISSYSIAKAAATMFLQMLHRTENFPVVILRFFLVYGPGQDQSRFLPQIILGCIKNSTFQTSQGLQLRDFCYISDAVKAIFLALESSDANGEIFNIASGNAVSIKSVIEKIIFLIGKGRPEFGTIGYRQGENMELYAEISKAKDMLKWEPKVDLEEGLVRTIASLQKKD